jgi:hypothetical protein
LLLKVILQMSLKQGSRDGERLNLRIGRTGASLRAAFGRDDALTGGWPRAYRRFFWRSSARRRETRPRSVEPEPAPDRAAADAAGEWRLSIIAADFRPSLSLFRDPGGGSSGGPFSTIIGGKTKRGPNWSEGG